MSNIFFRLGHHDGRDKNSQNVAMKHASPPLAMCFNVSHFLHFFRNLSEEDLCGPRSPSLKTCQHKDRSSSPVRSSPRMTSSTRRRQQMMTSPRLKSYPNSPVASPRYRPGQSPVTSPLASPLFDVMHDSHHS